MSVILLSECVISNIRGHEAVILRDLIEKDWVSKNDLIHLLYDSHEDGGPLFAEGIVEVMIFKLRRRLTPMFKIKCRHSSYKLIRK